MEQDKLWEFQQTEQLDSFLGSQARLNHLVKLLKSGDKVLNIGVGNGIFEETSLQHGIEIYSVDPSEKAINLLRTRLNLGDRAKAGRGESLPFPDEMFDAVVVSEVLEHLSDDVLTATLAEIRRVLKDGGQIIGTVPNKETLSDQIVVCPHCGVQFHRWGHVRAFDTEAMRSTLGYQFQAVRVKEKLFVSWGILNWKGKLVAMIKLLLFKLGVHGRNENLVFVAHKQ